MTTVARYMCVAGDRGGVLDALAPARRATIEEAGCEYFIVLTPQDAPNDIVLIEGWQTIGDLKSHRRTTHFRQIILGEIANRVSSRAVEICEQIDIDVKSKVAAN